MLDKSLKVVSQVCWQRAHRVSGPLQLCCHAHLTWGVVHPMLDYHGKCSWSRGVTEAMLRKDMQQDNTAHVPCLAPMHCLL